MHLGFLAKLRSWQTAAGLDLGAGAPLLDVLCYAGPYKLPTVPTYPRYPRALARLMALSISSCSTRSRITWHGDGGGIYQ